MARLVLVALLLISAGAACSDETAARDGGRRDRGRPDLFVYFRDRGPDRAPVEPDLGAVRRAPFKLDFETSGGGLVASRDWQWGKLAFVKGSGCDGAATPPTAGHSGRGVWGTVLNDCHQPLDNAKESCKNAVTTDDSVLKLEVEIPSTLSKPRLSWWEWNDYFLPFDWTEVRIDGQVVRQDCTGSWKAPTAWVQQSIDLTLYRGQTITIAFHFMASSVINHAGWYIDDLEIGL